MCTSVEAKWGPSRWTAVLVTVVVLSDVGRGLRMWFGDSPRAGEGEKHGFVPGNGEKGRRSDRAERSRTSPRCYGSDARKGRPARRRRDYAMRDE